MLGFSRWTIWISILVCVLGVLVALPNVLPQAWRDQMPDWVPKQTLNLGLDLRGGSQLLLGVDVNTVYKDRLDATRDEVRIKLRDAGIGYTGLAVVGADTIQVKMRDGAQLDAANEVLRGIIVQVGGGLLGGGGANNYDLTRGEDGSFTLTMTEGARTFYRTQAVAQSIEVVRRRIDELGTLEPTIQQQGEDRILVQVPGLDDPQSLIDLLGKTAKLEFRFVDETANVQEAVAGRVPPGADLLYEGRDDATGNPGIPLVIEKRVIVTGESLKNAQQSFDSRTGQATVSFEFDTQGARKFGDATKENVGRRFAIVLDEEVVSAPRIQEPILGGSGQITGDFTVESANNLAILLRAGALPAPLNIEEQRTVGAELGADSIADGTLAAIVGVSATVVLMVLCYGLFGMFAVIGLVLNLVLTIALMTLIGATMTLPGIAGLILSIGMTIDANVLYYERMREERNNGKAAVSTLSGGFQGAKSAIFDANVTQVLACAILFQFGSGPVRGFAVTLGLGVMISMFTAVLLTRIMIVQWYKWRRPKVLPI